MPQMRLDKLLSHLNCGSRKEVQALIRAGRVSVDGTVQKDPAFKVDPDRSQTAVDGTVQRYRAQRYYMLNKPMGVITASRDKRHDTVLELFPAELRRGLFAVGRLDKDTEGLLLITDDGALSHALMSPNRHVEKEYEAVVDGALAADAVLRFEQGMTLRDGTECKPAKLEILETEPELRVRGYNVDVGIVDVFAKNSEGKRVHKQLEVDFVVNQGSQRYYIQVAYDMTSEEKQTQELNSLRNIPDSFKKIIIVNGTKKPWRNEEGFVIMGMKYFLLNADSLGF